MLQQRITKPFGEDEDANNAILDVLDTVGQLSFESRRLNQPFKSAAAESATLARIGQLHGDICSRARSVFIPADEFLQKAVEQLQARAGREIKIYLPQPEGAPPPQDDELRRLQKALLDAQILEEERGKRLRRARELFSDAQGATAAAARAVDARRAALAGAAS